MPRPRPGPAYAVAEASTSPAMAPGSSGAEMAGSSPAPVPRWRCSKTPGHSGDAAHRAHLDRALHPPGTLSGRAGTRLSLSRRTRRRDGGRHHPLPLRERCAAGENCVPPPQKKPPAGPAPEIEPRQGLHPGIGIGPLPGPRLRAGGRGVLAAAARLRHGRGRAAAWSAAGQANPDAAAGATLIWPGSCCNRPHQATRGYLDTPAQTARACLERERNPSVHETSGRRPRPRHAGCGAHRPDGHARCHGAVDSPPANLDPHLALRRADDGLCTEHL